MFHTLLINALILLTYYLLTGSIILRKFETKPSLLHRGVIPGVLSGTLGITLIYFSVKVNGVLFDLRHIPIVAIASFSSIPALWICVSIIAAARLLLFQPFATAAAAASFIIMMGIGSHIFARLFKNISLRFAVTLVYTTALEMIWYSIGLSKGLDAHVPFAAAFSIISLVVGTLCYLIMASGKRQIQLSCALQETNSKLVKQQRVLEDQNEELILQQEELNRMVAAVQEHSVKMEMTNLDLEAKQTDLQILLLQVKEQEQHYRQLVKWLPDAVLIYQGGSIVYANNMAATLVHAPSATILIGKRILDFIPLGNQQAFPDQENNAQGQRSEAKLIRLDGKMIDVELFGQDISFQGQPAMLAILRDISLRKDAERKLLAANKTLEMLAHADGLTGIANRRYFDHFLEQEWISLQQAEASLSLILFDIDYFKLYNDYYGHQKGDDVLQQVAQSVTDCLSGVNCLFARYGGEEFAVLLPHTKAEEGKRIAEMLCSSIEALHIPHQKSQVSRFITGSFGVAAAERGTFKNAADLISAADQALYTAKRNGKNRVTAASDAALSNG